MALASAVALLVLAADLALEVAGRTLQQNITTVPALPVSNEDEFKGSLHAVRIQFLANVTVSQEDFPEISRECFHQAGNASSGVSTCQPGAVVYKPNVFVDIDAPRALWTGDDDAFLDARFLQRALLVTRPVTLQGMHLAQMFDDRPPYFFMFATIEQGALLVMHSTLYSPCGGRGPHYIADTLLPRLAPDGTYSVDAALQTIYIGDSGPIPLADAVNGGEVVLRNTTVQCYDDTNPAFAGREVPANWAAEAESTVADVRDACQNAATEGEDYRGTVHVTAEGLPCQFWNVTEPQDHVYLPSRFPEYGLGASDQNAHNYCRNPDNTAEGVWCYVASEGTQSPRRGQCDVPVCDGTAILTPGAPVMDPATAGPDGPSGLADDGEAPGAASDGIDPAVIAAAAVGVAAAVCVAGALFVWRRRRRPPAGAVPPPESPRSAQAAGTTAAADGTAAAAVPMLQTAAASLRSEPEFVTMTGWDDTDRSLGVAMVKPPPSRGGSMALSAESQRVAPNELISMTGWDDTDRSLGVAMVKPPPPRGSSMALSAASQHTPPDFVTMTAWSGNTESTFIAAGSSAAPTMSTLQSRTVTAQTPASASARSEARSALVEALQNALDEMHEQQQLLAGRWELLDATHRRVGGQGVVQFITDTTRQDEDMVAKFFLYRAAFQRESELYSMPAVREMMPAVVDLRDNQDGALVAPNGCQLPPFIVLEKGRSLNEWALITRPDYATCLQVLVQIVERLNALHACGLVHRDVKPANILWRPDVGLWTLIDFGCATAHGEEASIACSIAYAPPEVAWALKEKRRVMTADTSMDVWALGVVMYELLVGGEREFPKRSTGEIIDALTSPDSLPWEGANLSTRKARKLGLVKRIVKLCLSRDPSERPSAETLLGSMDSLFRSATTASQSSSQAACM